MCAPHALQAAGQAALQGTAVSTVRSFARAGIPQKDVICDKRPAPIACAWYRQRERV